MGGLRKSWWHYFKQSIVTYKQGGDRFIGREANGNRYYERKLGTKLKRYVLNDADMMIPSNPLWRSWLSYKRKEPPTDEEVLNNLKQVQQLQEKAAVVLERDLKMFPKFAEKVKESETKMKEERKNDFPRYKEYI